MSTNSTKRLWDFYDGEAFLENPHEVKNPYVAVINPKRGKRKMAATRRRRRTVTVRRRKRVRVAAPKRRKRRNSYASAGPVVARANPVRRRRRTTRVTRRRRHSKARRNPSIMGLTLPSLNSVLFTGAGFIAPPMLEGFLYQFLPAEVSGNVLGRYAIRIGSVVALSMLTKQVIGSAEAKNVALGGVTYIAMTAISEFMPDMVIASIIPPNSNTMFEC